MEKSPTEARDGDIAQEKYQGPSAAVAAAGASFFEHFVWAGVALAAGAGAALFFPNKVAKLLTDWRAAAKAAKESTDIGGLSTIKRWIGAGTQAVLGEGAGTVHITGDAAHAHTIGVEIMNRERGFGHFLTSHLLFGPIPYIGKRGKDWLIRLSKAGADTQGERFTNILTVGGVLGAGGYIAGAVKGMFDGAKNANKGKEQFERAQDEIVELRRVNGTLERANEEIRQKYIETATQLRDAKTGEPIRVSGDDAGASSRETDEDAAATQASHSITLAEKQHHGMLHAHAPEVGSSVAG